MGLLATICYLAIVSFELLEKVLRELNEKVLPALNEKVLRELKPPPKPEPWTKKDTSCLLSCLGMLLIFDIVVLSIYGIAVWLGPIYGAFLALAYGLAYKQWLEKYKKLPNDDFIEQQLRSSKNERESIHDYTDELEYINRLDTSAIDGED